MGSAFNLGKIFGIQFRLHYSWFIIFALLTFFLSEQVFPQSLAGQPRPAYWAMGIITSLIFFGSVLTHELAHSIVGRANGIPITSITLFIFGGAAHMTREANRAGEELKMAIAGPVSSLLLSGAFYVVSLYFDGLINQVALMAYWLAWINMVLAVFNLLPGFPLDGGRVLRALIWHFSGNYMNATRIATQAGRAIGYLFIFGGIGIILTSQNWLSGVWLIFIGWFLADTAQTSYRQAQLQDVLRGFTASQAMTQDFVTVSGETTVIQLLQEHNADSHNKYFLVTEEDRVEGIITLHNIISIGQQDRYKFRIKDIAVPLEKVPVTHPEQDVLSIVQRMNESGIDQMPVVSEGRVVGLVTLDNLIGFVRSHSHLKISSR